MSIKLNPMNIKVSKTKPKHKKSERRCGGSHLAHQHSRGRGMAREQRDFLASLGLRVKHMSQKEKK